MLELIEDYTEELTTLHNKAIKVAEIAFGYERRGLIQAATELYHSAFIIEKTVADKLLKIETPKLSKCMILQSTMNLAKSAGLPIQGKKYAKQILQHCKYPHIQVEAGEYLKQYTYGKI
jgi:hypothetical protein